MQFSKFGQKFTQKSGILQLMDDLGNALASDQPINMLGGGNPAKIAAVNENYQRVLEKIVAENQAIDSIANYSTPQGDSVFIQTLADFFRAEYGWDVQPENIALTNGSQNAFFYLFNLFGGEFDSGNKKILLPLAPEYIGYADAHISGSHFLAVRPEIERVQHNNQAGFFKYRVDFDALAQLPEWERGEIGAICCSRPTNPTGNVLTDKEMAQLDALAQKHGVPLIIDNAYGAPFPNIIHTDNTLIWHDNIVLCFSLSKIGLPSARTGIVLANKEIIKAISSLNAIINLSPTRFGAAIATPMLQDGSLKDLSDNVIRPFYAEQAEYAISLLQQEFKDYPLAIHQPEGAIFLWLWFENLPISTNELYEILKQRGTLIIPSELFFVGLDTADYRHAHECIRMSIAGDKTVLQQGISTIGEVVRGLYDQ
ncbi:valine--pyruvate transaminase [Alysiella crassa]|uniref:Putative 8-amino-7-oxononanoate synthase n=1 Tax=Alysiella crassa TaxID=153491 RepID=A0A376BU00_9NEIS|nr:valine--pyruvate transaminase [Alysiella crassa]UOP06009.1 valine--pyruvate transaminase [Alysiella crassa]SSY80457.1 Aspartate aminotransferase [Alysiella crassa]